MYHSTDPRAALAATPVGTKPAATRFSGAEYAKFYETRPAEDRDGARTWYARGQNFIIAYSEAGKDATLGRTDQPDEYVVLLPDPGAGAEIIWGSEHIAARGHSISFVPAGTSSVKLLGAAKVVRMMTTRSADLARLCSNADSYAAAHPNLPAFEPWPEASGGPRIRSYSLDVAQEPGRFGRIFRCSTFMVNFLEPRNGPATPPRCRRITTTISSSARWRWREPSFIICAGPGPLTWASGAMTIMNVAARHRSP
jgi:hypothetical protein